MTPTNIEGPRAEVADQHRQNMIHRLYTLLGGNYQPQQDSDAKLYNFRNNIAVRSGDVFTLKTDDPETSLFRAWIFWKCNGFFIVLLLCMEVFILSQ